jgi:hypothetical protein
MGKKVLRYTEDEFITLLENIVKRVKKEETLNESKKEKYDTTKNIVRRNRR